MALLLLCNFSLAVDVPITHYLSSAHSLIDEDYIVAIPAVAGKRLMLAQATRVWRGGLRTFLAINNEDAVAKLNRHPGRCAQTRVEIDTQHVYREV